MADEIPAFEDEDIPADIWQTAEGMAVESDGHPGVWSLKESLARAIYIERERCAKIAEKVRSYDAGEDLMRKEIAAAIRRGPA